LFSAVISEHFSKNRVIISAVAAKIRYLKIVQFLLGHPVFGNDSFHILDAMNMYTIVCNKQIYTDKIL